MICSYSHHCISIVFFMYHKYNTVSHKILKNAWKSIKCVCNSLWPISFLGKFFFVWLKFWEIWYHSLHRSDRSKFWYLLRKCSRNEKKKRCDISLVILYNISVNYNKLINDGVITIFLVIHFLVIGYC